MAYEVRLSLTDFLDATQVAVDRMRVSSRRGLNHANVRNSSMFTRPGCAAISEPRMA